VQENNLTDYRDLLKNDSLIEKEKDLEIILKKTAILAERKSWVMLNSEIFKVYLKGDIHKHYAMKLYYKYEKCPI
jgi:hypothetical protein